MTELLRQAISQLEQLPDEAQDAIAARILADLADERAWAERFDATTDEQWDRLIEDVHRDIAANGTSPLQETFPPTAPDV